MITGEVQVSWEHVGRDMSSRLQEGWEDHTEEVIFKQKSKGWVRVTWGKGGGIEGHRPLHCVIPTKNDLLQSVNTAKLRHLQVESIWNSCLMRDDRSLDTKAIWMNFFCFFILSVFNIHQIYNFWQDLWHSSVEKRIGSFFAIWILCSAVCPGKAMGKCGQSNEM